MVPARDARSAGLGPVRAVPPDLDAPEAAGIGRALLLAVVAGLLAWAVLILAGFLLFVLLR